MKHLLLSILAVATSLHGQTLTNVPTITGANVVTASDKVLLLDASTGQMSKVTFSELVNVPSLFGNVSATELGYLDGVTSSVQTQLDAKSPLAGSSSITTIGTLASGTVPVARITGLGTAATAAATDFAAAISGPFADNDAAIRAGVSVNNPWEKTDHSLWRAAPPSVTKIAIFGDSRADQSGSGLAYSANGIAYWTQMATGFRLGLVKNASPLNGTANSFAFAQGGQTWETMNNNSGSYPRVAELIASCPPKTVVLCYNGTNGMSNPATNYASFVTVISRFIAADLWPIVFLEPDTGIGQTEPTYNANRDTYNTSVEAYCLANSIPYIDIRSEYHSGGGPSFPYLFYSDGGFIHPNIKGAAIIGKAFARKVESLYDMPDFPVTYASTAGLVSADRGFASGVFGNGSTTGYNTTSSNCTLARSMVARSDGQPGNWARLAITNFAEGGATGTGAGSAQLYWSTTTMPANGNYRAVVEVEVDEWLETAATSGYVNGKYILLMATAQGGTSSTARVGLVSSSFEFQAHTLGFRGSVNPAPANKKIALISEVFTVGGANTSLGINLYPYGNMIIRVGNMAIIPE